MYVYTVSMTVLLVTVCMYVFAACLYMCVRVRVCVCVCVLCDVMFTLQGTPNLALHTKPYTFYTLHTLFIIHSIATSCRNPVHSERPTAADILGDFCKSERVLLGWRVEDTVPLLSRTLGAPLSEGETLHRDLQNKYKGH